MVRAGLKGQGGELLHDVLRPLHLLALPRQHGAVLVKGSQLCSSTGSIEGLVVVLHESLGGEGAKASRTEIERKREGVSARRFARALEKKYSQLEPNKSPQIVWAFDLGRKEGIERKGPRGEGGAGKGRRSYLSHALEVAHSHALSYTTVSRSLLREPRLAGRAVE